MTKVEAAKEEYANWSRALGIKSLADLNTALKEGYGSKLITICEARQERKYADIADLIFGRRNKSRIVMMSGPSSSGKTSTSHRIANQCVAIGLWPKVLELDNYFVDRDKTPLDENGEMDFECLGAMDVEFLNRQLNELLDGKEIEVPRFDFESGKRVFDGTRMQLKENELLFMEGIHALNPDLTPNVDQSKIFRIYISALSAIPGGEKVHNSTTDKRLMRRIVRDNRSRGISPEESILRWPSVRRGETLNIFPYETNADAVFNSSTLYDLPMLKRFAQPLLEKIGPDSPAYEKAHELCCFLEGIIGLTDEELAVIPPQSIMREFIGGQIL